MLLLLGWPYYVVVFLGMVQTDRVVFLMLRLSHKLWTLHILTLVFFSVTVFAILLVVMVVVLNTGSFPFGFEYLDFTSIIEALASISILSLVHG